MARRPAPEETTVTFRLRAEGASFVDLRGEMTHFQHVRPMKEVAPGLFEATTRLGAGVYSYKLFGGEGRWWMDPENPRTRGRDGVRNSVIVVGGTDEPLLHAPARPFVYTLFDGRLVVRAGLRRGHGESLSVRWDEGDGPRESRMAVVAEEDEHSLFEAHLPVSARSVEYLFALSDGALIGRAGARGQAFSIRRESTLIEPPDWWRKASLYTIFVDRFRRGEQGTWGAAPDHPAGRWGGDLAGVTASLPYLADLGVTALHLTPIQLAPSAHRYDAVDPRAIDPTLGGEAALTRLFEEAHERGLRVMLDVSATHVDRDFFAFRDVREKGLRSPYAGWFYVRRHPFTEDVFGVYPGYDHYQKGQWREPLLRADEPEVIAYLTETVAQYTRLGADGFRIDAAADLPFVTLRALADAARAVRPEVAVFGEVIPAHLHRYTTNGLDAATDFATQEALYDWLHHGRMGASRVAQIGARRRFDRGGPGCTAVAFTATHDQQRFHSLTADPRPARLAQLFVLLGAEIPALLYGDEVLLPARPHARDPASPAAFEGVWPDRAPMDWPAPGQATSPTWDLETRALVKEALRLRNHHSVFCEGDESYLPLEDDRGRGTDDVLLVRRTLGDAIVDMVFHGGEGTRTVTLPAGAPSAAEVLLTLGEARLLPSPINSRPDSSPAQSSANSGEPASANSTAAQASSGADLPESGADSAPPRVELGPYSALVVRRVPPAESLALWGEVVSHTAAISGLSFREGSLVSAPLPAHLYLTVTERCNLACAHCITSAPDKTSSGRARTLAPWVIDALREPFAAADYIGFVHGGESIVAPIFWDVLTAIQSARATRPGKVDIHLLSNGMLLTEDRVRRLLDHGLTSLSVSLDGATEITNDSLRLGGRLPTIIENLRRAAAIRRETGADLRMGVSTVVTAGNVTELADLGRIVADLGLDWLKVEEIYACTPTARHQNIHARDPRVEQAMNDLRAALSRTPVVIVDHRDPPGGCACEAEQNPRLADFRRADDFANRVTFHPCRMEWEQACIDPDGAVHPVDYGRPSIGNLLTTSLLELWNGPEMASLRQAALGRTPRRIRVRCSSMKV